MQFLGKQTLVWVASMDNQGWLYASLTQSIHSVFHLKTNKHFRWILLKAQAIKCKN